MKKNLAAQLLGLAVVLLLAGCTTYQTTWDNRVGVYTYDQAVKELGPPDKQAKLTDGQTVAEWISRYATGGTVGVGMGSSFYNGPATAGVGVMQTAPTYRESQLRLTFGTNNILSAWTKN